MGVCGLGLADDTVLAMYNWGREACPVWNRRAETQAVSQPELKAPIVEATDGRIARPVTALVV